MGASLHILLLVLLAPSILLHATSRGPSTLLMSDPALPPSRSPFPDSLCHSSPLSQENEVAELKFRPALQLRGGAVRESRTVEAPSENFPTVHDGLAAVCKGDLLRIAPGLHRWRTPALIGARTVAVEGSGGSWIVGPWQMFNGSMGSIDNLTLASDEVDVQGLFRTVAIEEGHWNLTDCEVQSVGGTALSAAYRARVEGVRCVVGGAGPDPEMARVGVDLTTESRVVLRGCSVSHTTGFGVRVHDDAVATLLRCRLTRNSVAFFLQDDAEIGVYESVVNSERAGFRITDESRYTVRVVMKGNTFNEKEAPLWLAGAMPHRMPYHPSDVAGTEEMSGPDVLIHSQFS